jgi:hypothetical protein
MPTKRATPLQGLVVFVVLGWLLTFYGYAAWHDFWRTLVAGTVAIILATPLASLLTHVITARNAPPAAPEEPPLPPWGLFNEEIHAVRKVIAEGPPADAAHLEQQIAQLSSRLLEDHFRLALDEPMIRYAFLVGVFTDTTVERDNPGQAAGILAALVYNKLTTPERAMIGLD